MAGLQVTKEDDRFFHLQSPSGKELKVAKSGLSSERQETYRSQLSPANPAQDEMDEGDPAFNFAGRPDKILMPSQLSQPQMTPLSQNVSPLAGLSASSQGVGQPLPSATPSGLGMAGADVGVTAPTAPSMIPVSTTVQKDVQPGVKLDPQLTKDIKQSFELEAQAAKDQIEAQKDFQTAYATESAKLQTELAKVNSQFDIIEKNRQEAAAKPEADFRETIQKLQDAKVDPNRIYGGSTGKRVLAGIAIGLGEFGRALTGGSSNAALKIINDAIDRDIRSQEQDIKNLGSQATLQRQLLAEIDDKYDDKVTANKLKRAVLLDAAERKALDLAKNLKGQEEIAQAQQFIAGIQRQKADALMQAQQIEADKATIRTTTQLLSPQAQASKAEGKAFEQSSKLRQEYNKNPMTMRTAELSSNISTIQAAYDRKTPASDLSFIIAYMKMLDPGSVVREGEVEIARRTENIPGQVWNAYQRASEGRILSDDQRDDFYQQSLAIMNRQKREQAKVDKRYKGLAERAGIPVEDVIIFQEPEDKDPREVSKTFVSSGLGG